MSLFALPPPPLPLLLFSPHGIINTMTCHPCSLAVIFMVQESPRRSCTLMQNALWTSLRLPGKWTHTSSLLLRMSVYLLTSDVVPSTTRQLAMLMGRFTVRCTLMPCAPDLTTGHSPALRGASFLLLKLPIWQNYVASNFCVMSVSQASRLANAPESASLRTSSLIGARTAQFAKRPHQPIFQPLVRQQNQLLAQLQNPQLCQPALRPLIQLAQTALARQALHQPTPRYLPRDLPRSPGGAYRHIHKPKNEHKQNHRSRHRHRYGHWRGQTRPDTPRHMRVHASRDAGGWEGEWADRWVGGRTGGWAGAQAGGQPRG